MQLDERWARRRAHDAGALARLSAEWGIAFCIIVVIVLTITAVWR